jgi:hypothetical protein
MNEFGFTLNIVAMKGQFHDTQLPESPRREVEEMESVRHRPAFFYGGIDCYRPRGSREPGEGRQQSHLRASRLSRRAGQIAVAGVRFRDTASKLLAKHDLKVVGYWVSEDAPASDDTLIYIVAHPGRQEAKKNWDAMFADPAFQAM